MRQRTSASPQLRRFEASTGSMVTRKCFDVAADDLRRVGGQEPSVEPRQMINNRDLANDVCSCRQSFFPPAQDFISLRGS